jgi:hypothetical protein
MSGAKILFIADEIPQSINAGSIQFMRLLKSYPSENLLIIGRKPMYNAEILNCKYYTFEIKLIDRLRLSRLARYLTDIQSIGLALPKLPKQLQKIADDFKPDLIISLMQFLPFYYAAYHYSKEKKLPLVLFCHDDTEDFANPHNIFRKKLVKLNAKIYQAASSRICISPEMARAWEKKYGAKSEFLYPTFSDAIQGRNLEKSIMLVNGSTLTIGYAGSLAYGYLEGINEIVTILEETNTKLKIFRDVDNRVEKSPNIEFMGYAETPEETWKKISEQCDSVILPYSEEKKFKQLYSTHFPSKLPEYTKLNMPIIVIGPPYANGIKWCRSKNGMLSGDKKELKNLINFLLFSSNRLKCIEQISRIKDFEHHSILEKFRKIIGAIYTHD